VSAKRDSDEKIGIKQVTDLAPGLIGIKQKSTGKQQDGVCWVRLGSTHLTVQLNPIGLHVRRGACAWAIAD
jgi:hypothetical protein